MLYIISTPIGNLGDVTLRAIEILEKVDVLLCEDTRVTGNLLNLLKIKNKPKLMAFYDEVEEQKIPEVIKLLENELKVALVSDAGTPLLSDPGWKLVLRCQKLGIKYTALPGPSAITNALVLSGLPIGRFSFLGFLPKKPGERKKILERYSQVEGAKVVFESAKRVERLFQEIKEVCGDGVKIRCCWEMTKKFEKVSDTAKFEKGEVVVVFT